uniref:Uncharacterized protein n=1 Tax=Avena sativa TaxID=4498 RepID=A0ACD5VM40_AVESA
MASSPIPPTKPPHPLFVKSCSPMMPRSCWFSVFVYVWWLPLMLAGAEEQQQQGEAGCSGSDKKCGNLTISYPFWLRETAEEEQGSAACAPPDFEVTCLSNDTPVLPSSLPSSLGFAIMDILYEEDSLRVVDLGRTRLSQASNGGCGIQIWNTSDKLGRPFSIAPANVNLVLYNCTDASAARRDGALVETSLGCGNHTQVFVEASDSETSYIAGCDAVVLPVLGGANGRANASDYDRLIGDGFLMTWENPPTPARKFTHANHV